MTLLEQAQSKWPIEKLCKRPWVANTLMIEDAKGNVVAHLGGMVWEGKTADPYFITSLVAYIVDAVNSLPEDIPEADRCGKLIHCEDDVYDCRLRKGHGDGCLP